MSPGAGDEDADRCGLARISFGLGARGPLRLRWPTDLKRRQWKCTSCIIHESGGQICARRAARRFRIGAELSRGVGGEIRPLGQPPQDFPEHPSLVRLVIRTYCSPLAGALVRVRMSGMTGPIPFYGAHEPAVSPNAAARGVSPTHPRGPPFWPPIDFRRGRADQAGGCRARTCTHAPSWEAVIFNFLCRAAAASRNRSNLGMRRLGAGVCFEPGGEKLSSVHSCSALSLFFAPKLAASLWRAQRSSRELRKMVVRLDSALGCSKAGASAPAWPDRRQASPLGRRALIEVP